MTNTGIDKPISTATLEDRSNRLRGLVALMMPTRQPDHQPEDHAADHEGDGRRQVLLQHRVDRLSWLK